MNRSTALMIALSILLCSVSASSAERPTATAPQVAPATPGQRLVPARGKMRVDRPSLAAAADTTLFGDWTFDDGMGGPDPQGWTTLDFTAQIDTFFHVDDFSGLGGPWTPLAGSRSLWCGTATGGGGTCYPTTPGYGNGWEQRFESVAFAVTGDVTMNYLIRYDNEPGYDYTYVEYFSKSGQWNQVAQYTGTGDTLSGVFVFADSLDGTVRLRFRFVSDVGASDEDGFYDSDGAVVLDSITVSDGGGVVDFQDFESEAVGALSTADGDWTASVGPGYGDYAALLDGTSVLQEDPLVTNNTYLWGFFDGSPANYACGGHAEQLAVPYGKIIEGQETYIHNGIVSPALALPALSDTTRFLLEFDVYRDLPYAPFPLPVFYTFGVRSKVDGCWQPWGQSQQSAYFGADKDWFRFRQEIGSFMNPGPTEIQVAIQVWDFGGPTCHSHSPLVDNVRMFTVEGPHQSVVTNTHGSGPGSLHQAILDIASHGSSFVSFDIPGGGIQTIAINTDTLLPLVPSMAVIDGSTQPGYAGTPLIRLDYHAYNPPTGGGLLGIGADGSVVRGLEMVNSAVDPSNPALGVHIQNADGVVVQGCRIEGFTSGIHLNFTSSDCMIGGTGPNEANEITGNGIGVNVGGTGSGNTIRGNQIHDNVEAPWGPPYGLGIDLGWDGVTVNDPLDADTGPNNLQNYPQLSSVTVTSGTIAGTLDSEPNTQYEVDFYASSSCDPLGYGEGENYLGSTTVTTDGTGHAAFAPVVPGFNAGEFITATATDPAGNTSEFSACMLVLNLFVVTNTDSSGPGSLRQALLDLNSQGPANISFDIPGGGLHTIVANTDTSLPSVQVPCVIDGTTQPGYVDTPLIRLAYNAYGPGLGTLLSIEADGTVVRGLELVDWAVLGGNEAIGIQITDASGGVVQGCRVEGFTTGINIVGTSSGLSVGGTVANEANELTGNGTGVRIWSSTGNSIRGNSIYDNVARPASLFFADGLGVDLGTDGVTANDPLDADTGANNLQNYPVVSAVGALTGSIQGTLDSAPSTQYEIDFYASGACDPSGHGEGERYLGSTTVTTDGAGHAAFNVVVPGFGTGEWITAMATSPGGDTSEFSQCIYSGHGVPSFLVTNTNDSGAGSLRQAILDANVAVNLNAILFNIPGSGPHTIAPVTALPDLTQPVIIDGYSQAGSSVNTSDVWESGNAVLRIMLDGSSLGGTENGLLVNADGCTIRGLAIGNFPANGIRLVGDGSVVDGCYIGTDALGTTAEPNGVGIFAGANSDNNVIGGTEPAARNVVSGNTAEGIHVATCLSNTVRGNFVGVNAAGTSGLGNGTYGVRLGKARECYVWSNLVSGNGSAGLGIFGPTVTGNDHVRNNRIGTDVTGTGPLGNTGDGVYIASMAAGGDGIVIGGFGFGNLIAYNGGDGVDAAVPTISSITVSYNIIDSNARGAVVTEGLSTGGVVNIIRNNITDNTGLGIDLGDDGVTANDAQDADTGPNGLQNYPVLTSATGSGGNITVAGTLNSTPGTSFVVEFFSNTSCDPSGYGEGATYLGSTTVMTDGSGDANINAVLSVSIPGGQHITATARPSAGGGTSEFATCLEYTNTPSGTDVVVVPVAEGMGQTPVTMTFDNVTGSGNTTLIIEDAGPAVPGSFTLSDSAAYWNLSTTAMYTDSIEVCFTYDENQVPLPESNLVILHYDTTLVPADWVDITTMVDTITNVICGKTATLSPFVAAGTKSPTGIGDPGGSMPSAFALLQNVPNPFNPTTTIGFEVPTGGARVTIRIYDVAGRLVRTVVNEYRAAGRHRVPWDGRNQHGARVATGVYFYRMEAGSFAQTRKMLLLK